MKHVNVGILVVEWALYPAIGGTVAQVVRVQEVEVLEFAVLEVVVVLEVEVLEFTVLEVVGVLEVEVLEFGVLEFRSLEVLDIRK